MDHKTHNYYEKNADKLVPRYESADMSDLNRYRNHFPSNGKLLDIGCGSGRDAAYFFSKGYDVIAIDASTTMIKHAIQKHPELRNRIKSSQFPFPNINIFKEKFDIIICVAVMMHIQDHNLFECIYQLRKLLKPNGLVLISISNHRKNLDDDQRDNKGRLFIERQPEEYQLMFERFGFTLNNKESNQDGLGRNDIKWTSLLFQYQGEGVLRPADQIETIIVRDRKDATYKLALLRALCDIAISEYKQAKWLDGGKIGIPLGLVAEKWIYYYWPIFESKQFIPQKRGKEINKPINFREVLSKLIEFYSFKGGLNRFYVDFRGGTIPDNEAKELTDIVLNKIAAEGIVKGPIQYSGGALETNEPFFTCTTPYQKKGKCFSANGAIKALGTIIFSSEIWREFCLIGYWIREALCPFGKPA
jgi:SAM-dependent methyltransferase